MGKLMCDALPSKFFENAPGALHRTITLLISSLILLVPCAVNGWPFVFPVSIDVYDRFSYDGPQPRNHYFLAISHMFFDRVPRLKSAYCCLFVGCGGRLFAADRRRLVDRYSALGSLCSSSSNGRWACICFQ